MSAVPSATTPGKYGATPSLLETLIGELSRMPGIGRKSAQRIAYHLLLRDRPGARSMAQALLASMDGIGHCTRCRCFSEQDECTLCTAANRDDNTLCVVESPADVFPLEDAGFRGRYFVLLGRLSPLDGIGPEQLGLELLLQRVQKEAPKEVLLATNPTVEGEATAHLIHDLLATTPTRVTRLAQGIPVGGELGYLDQGTLIRAINNRREI